MAADFDDLAAVRREPAVRSGPNGKCMLGLLLGDAGFGAGRVPLTPMDGVNGGMHAWKVRALTGPRQAAVACSAIGAIHMYEPRRLGRADCGTALHDAANQATSAWHCDLHDSVRIFQI